MVSINPEVIAVTPAIKVELGRKGPLEVRHFSCSPVQLGCPPGCRRFSPSLGPVRSKILD
jgi:hypothetical protein